MKSKLIIVQDGCYESFFENAYPDMVERGMPVVLAPDFMWLGRGGRITLDEVLRLSKENGNELNYHGWHGTPLREASPQEVYEDTLLSVGFLEAHGIETARLWRASWCQNSADNWQAAKHLFRACASWNRRNGVNDIPLQEPYNIKRFALQNRELSHFDDLAYLAEEAPRLLMCYTHGCEEGGKYNIKQHEWDYFWGRMMGLVDRGILEVGTFAMFHEELLSE